MPVVRYSVPLTVIGSSKVKVAHEVVNFKLFAAVITGVVAKQPPPLLVAWNS